MEILMDLLQRQQAQIAELVKSQQPQGAHDLLERVEATNAEIHHQNQIMNGLDPDKVTGQPSVYFQFSGSLFYHLAVSTSREADILDVQCRCGLPIPTPYACIYTYAMLYYTFCCKTKSRPTSTHTHKMH